VCLIKFGLKIGKHGLSKTVFIKSIRCATVPTKGKAPKSSWTSLVYLKSYSRIGSMSICYYTLVESNWKRKKYTFLVTNRTFRSMDNLSNKFFCLNFIRSFWRRFWCHTKSIYI
jgi:hypothetical protein